MDILYSAKNCNHMKMITQNTDPFKDSFENLALELAQYTQEFYDLRRMAKKHGYPINNKGKFVT